MTRSRLHLYVLWLLLASFGGTNTPAPARAQTIGTTLIIGYSGQGRPIEAVRFGNGSRKLVVVGDTHGGPEANTYVLTTQLIDYFQQHADQIPSDVRLYLVPTLNPDGLALGTRFNANGVDLNRNMNTDLDTCAENDWRTTVHGAYGLIADTGGAYADSEDESRVIRDFLLDANGAIFIHSNAGLVFPAFCEHAPSIAMGQLYAEGAGYLYNRYWPKYMITGGMHDWAGSLGIAAITPELVTGDDSEFAQNLAGLKAVLAAADTVLPAPEAHVENGIAIPAIIWRYWKAYGGDTRFGPPLAPPTAAAGVTRQAFVNAVLELHLDQADTGAIVKPALIGQAAAPVADDGSGHFFAATGHNLSGAFLAAWQRADGLRVYGLPTSEELTIAASDGQHRTAQRFERALLTRDPADGSVRAEPLGWAVLLRERLMQPTQPFQLR